VIGRRGGRRPAPDPYPPPALKWVVEDRVEYARPGDSFGEFRVTRRQESIFHACRYVNQSQVHRGLRYRTSAAAREACQRQFDKLYRKQMREADELASRLAEPLVVEATETQVSFRVGAGTLLDAAQAINPQFCIGDKTRIAGELCEWLLAAEQGGQSRIVAFLAKAIMEMGSGIVAEASMAVSENVGPQRGPASVRQIEAETKILRRMFDCGLAVVAHSVVQDRPLGDGSSRHADEPWSIRAEGESK